MPGTNTPVVLTLGIPGGLATTSEVKMAAPFSGRIIGAYVAVTTAPTGTALTASILVGSDTAAAFSIAAASNNDEATLTAANVDFNKGDIITLDILTVGGTVAGSNIVASIVVETETDATAVTISPDKRFG